MALSEEYVRVDTNKILDAADSLDAIVKKMEGEVDALKSEAASFDKDADWRGEAYTQWRAAYDKKLARVASDIEKYKVFSKFMRERVQTYLLAAAEADGIARNLDSEVNKLVADLLAMSRSTPREVKAYAQERGGE